MHGVCVCNWAEHVVIKVTDGRSPTSSSDAADAVSAADAVDEGGGFISLLIINFINFILNAFIIKGTWGIFFNPGFILYIMCGSENRLHTCVCGPVYMYYRYGGTSYC